MADRKRRYNAITSAASLLEPIRDAKQKTSPWQSEAWDFYDTGEALYFAATWFGAGLSQARLVAARRPDTADAAPEVVDDGPAADAIAQLAGGPGGQSRLLTSIGVQLTIAGETFLVGETTDDGTEWRVVTGDMLEQKQQHWRIKDDTGAWRSTSSDTLVARIWRQHEQRPWEPDSPARHVLPALREFTRAGEQIDATLASRLSGAGVYWLPEEAQFPAMAGEESSDPFADQLLAVMSTAISDQGSAAAITPLVARMKAEWIDHVKHDTFATDLDEKALTLRESAMRRVATGLDMPPELLLGLGDANHWTGWLLSDNAITWHIRPGMDVAAHGLTVGFLHPVLAAAGIDPTDWMVYYDLSDLTVRPDTSADALRLYDRFELTGSTLRRSTGFADSDKPDDDELEQLVFRKLTASPSTAMLGLAGLGIDVPAVPIVPGMPGMTVSSDDVSDAIDPGDIQKPAPTPSGAQSHGPPNTDHVAAAFPIAHRALERAGNKARTKLRASGDTAPDVPSSQLHTAMSLTAAGLSVADLLDGSCDEAVDVGNRLGCDPWAYKAAIVACVQNLLASGEPLTWDVLDDALQ